MTKRRILLDIDGVACDFITPTLKVLSQLTGRTFQHDDVQDWDIMKSLGISDEIAKETYKRVGAPGNVAAFPIYPGAKEGVARLKEIADVYAVTSPLASSRTWAREREEWLLEQLDIPTSNVVHTGAKHICLGNILVEDKAATLVKWREHTPYGTGILFKRAYNRNTEWDGVAVDDWPHLVRFVEMHFGLRDF